MLFALCPPMFLSLTVIRVGMLPYALNNAKQTDVVTTIYKNLFVEQYRVLLYLDLLFAVLFLFRAKVLHMLFFLPITNSLIDNFK